MRKYSWTRKGMVRDDSEGAYVQAADAEAERAELLEACKAAQSCLARIASTGKVPTLDDWAQTQQTIATAIRKAEGGAK